jgi:two-component system LytT family sensor kinase
MAIFPPNVDPMGWNVGLFFAVSRYGDALHLQGRGLQEGDFTYVAFPAEPTPDDTRWSDWRRAVLLATGLLWLSSFSVSTLRNVLDHMPSLDVVIVMRLATCLVGCLFCYIIHLILDRLEHRSLRLRLIAGAVLIVVVADGFTWVNALAIGWVLPSVAKTQNTPSQIILAVLYWVWLFFGWTAMYLAIRYNFTARAQERRWIALQRHAHVAQMRALRNQISPHFFFNTLNSISSLILDRTDEAEAMVARLAAFFRAGLAVDPLEDITLAEEIALQRLYLEIEKVRFPDMNFDLTGTDNVKDALVPPLILQPLVENAVKHGVAGSALPVTIAVTAHADRDQLVLRVHNDVPVTAASATNGTGTGLRNVSERLSLRFGDDASFAAGPSVPHGFTVTFSLPLRWAK